MFCPECGKPNPDENMFCQFCSAMLVDNTVPQSEDIFGSGASEDFSAYQPTQYEQPAPYDNSMGYRTPAPQNYQPQKPVAGYDYEPERNPADNPDIIVSVPKIDTGKVSDLIKKYKNILVPVVAAIVVLIGFFAIGNSLTAPERVAKKYFEALTENDFKGMYSYVSAPSGDFVSKDAYIAYMENIVKENPYYNIKSFNIEESNSDRYDFDFLEGNKSSPSSFTKKYRIEYIDDVTGYSGTYSIELVKQSKKTFLFFDNYKVGLGDMVCLNTSLTVPSGFNKVTIDDIKLSKGTTDESGNTVYPIEAIFVGKHTVKLESEITEPFEQEIYFGSGDSSKAIENYSSFVLKEDVLKNIENKAMIDFDKIYKSAIAGTQLSAAEIKTTKTYEKFPEHYSRIMNHIRREYDGQILGLKNISFTGFAMESDYSGAKSYSVSNNNGLTVSFNLKINYNCTVTENRYFDGIVTENRSKDGYVNFSYTLVDGEWVLNNMSSYTISY